MKTLLLLLVLVGSAAPVAAAECCGDCRGDGSVTIDDLITAVNNALGDCAAPTPTRTRTGTPTRRPTNTPTPADRCSASFADTVDGQCFFRGRYNRGCGSEVDATFASNGTTLIVAVTTGIPSPPTVLFSARVDSATEASLTAWSSDDFRTTHPTAGSVELAGNGSQLIIFPNDPPFMITGCNFVQYAGDYLGTRAAATDAPALDPASFARLRARPTLPPPEIADY